jgi:hypothetical protein
VAGPVLIVYLLMASLPRLWPSQNPLRMSPVSLLLEENAAARLCRAVSEEETCRSVVWG